MALLNTAVIITGLALGHTPVLPFGGVTEVTVGGVRGAPGFDAVEFLSGSPQPRTATASKNASIQILPTFNFRISFSSLPSCKAFQTVSSRPKESSFTGYF
jgi:hypothetical protein